MTEKTVKVSITIKIKDRTIEVEKEIEVRQVEEGIYKLIKVIGASAHRLMLERVDEEIQRGIPGKWKNVGREKRRILTSVGEVEYQRRVYRDERGKRRKPVDELLGVGRYQRASGIVREMGAYLACEGSYRHAASQMSWLVSRKVSANTIQRMAWETGEKIGEGEKAERERVFEKGKGVEGGKVVAPILHGESDGVWVHLQREEKKSVEVRVGILSSGKKRVGKGRFRLENKCCVTEIVENSQEWQETLLKAAHQAYDLSQTCLLVTGGDGNQWVRQSFHRLGIPEEFILDRFHLERAARHVLGRNAETRHLLQRMYQKGVGAIEEDLAGRIARAEGRDQKELMKFYHYLQNNRDGLMDLKYRACPQAAQAWNLGAIEGNVDKLVVHRMKGRGCSWRLSGARAMLALCRHKEELRQHGYRYLPVTTLPQVPHLRIGEAGNIHPASVPIFRGPDQAKPWVRQLKWSLDRYHSLSW